MIWILEHLWQSTLCAGAAWLAATALRNDSAALRHWIWCIASYKFLVPFALLASLGSRIDLGFEQHAPTLVASAKDVARIIAPGERLGDQVAALGSAHSNLATALLFIWISGSAVVLFRWLRGWWQAHCIRRHAYPGEFDLPVPVAITRELNDPAVVGVFRPVILMPSHIAEAIDRDHLESVLAHEMWHVKRRDNLTCAIHAVVEVLFWFHPAVWWIGNRMLEDRERACDEAVLNDGHESFTYAEAILRVCRLAQRSEQPLMLRAAGGDLKQRIELILSARTGRMSTRFKVATVALFGSAIFTAPVVAGAMFASGSSARSASTVILPGYGLVTLTPIASHEGRASMLIDAEGIHLNNSGIRDLVGIAYDVDPDSIRGPVAALQQQRFNVRMSLTHGAPDKLEPSMYRGLITALLAREFNIEIYVNQRCQEPCGRVGERTSHFDWPEDTQRGVTL